VATDVTAAWTVWVTVLVTVFAGSVTVLTEVTVLVTVFAGSVTVLIDCVTVVASTSALGETAAAWAFGLAEAASAVVWAARVADGDVVRDAPALAVRVPETPSLALETPSWTWPASVPDVRDPLAPQALTPVTIANPQTSVNVVANTEN
jgi:hypothetical protein